jgi:hypothetical protein
MQNLDEFVRYALGVCQNRFLMWETFVAVTKPARMAEIGVWKGEFAARILKACPSLDTYYMIDPWAKLPDWNKPWNVDMETFADVYQEAMAATDFAASKRAVLRGRTVEKGPEIPDESLDFAYIDGDHTLRGISIDLITIWDKIKPGGHIGGDDLSPNIWGHSKEFEPTLVFPFALYFAEAKCAPIYLLDHGQFLIAKPAVNEAPGFRLADLTGRYGDPSLRRQMMVVQG